MAELKVLTFHSALVSLETSPIPKLPGAPSPQPSCYKTRDTVITPQSPRVLEALLGTRHWVQIL